MNQNQNDDLVPLHPMHTIQFVMNTLKSSGMYPGARCTGRSTAIAFRVLADMIDKPRTPITVRDHHDTTDSHNRLAHQVVGLFNQLNLPGRIIVNVGGTLPTVEWWS